MHIDFIAHKLGTAICGRVFDTGTRVGPSRRLALRYFDRIPTLATAGHFCFVNELPQF